MERLANFDSLMIKQKKEWGEILTGFETKNMYRIFDPSGDGDMFFAAEQGGNFFLRSFLKSKRPFTLVIMEKSGKPIITIKRPFTFFLSEISVYDDMNRLIGHVNMNFALLRRSFSVYDSGENEVFEIEGPILRPWTFFIKEDGEEVGKITKKWSGLLKEAYTDADNFGIEFPERSDNEERAILLGAVFLIDFAYFENTK